MLVNNIDESTMGFLIEKESPTGEIVKEYDPAIMWNLSIQSYISAPPESCKYRAYGCDVQIAGGSKFNVYFKAMDFQSSFTKCHETIVNKTYGSLVLNRPIENKAWTEFIPKLLFEVRDTIKYQRPAKNIGLQFDYLVEQAFKHKGVIQLTDVEVVYADIVYDGHGIVIEKPVHWVIHEAYPHKVLVASKFTASGLRGYLKLFLPPYTATSSMRRKQQQIGLIGATGQHHYRLIVHNCGFCPGLMFASCEPETMKSTASNVALKAIGDPSAFLELNSTAEYIDLYRDSTSLPLVLDDLDREKKQKDLLVGSLNAANKYTVGRGKMQKLSGMILTKNIEPDTQKMPQKITEGRLNWLNMRMDPTYENEEMETNMENMFEHVNEMANTDMPRDYLASQSKHFFREEGEKYSSFQKFQTEACLLLEQRRPHWRKRKVKSASQFLSMFYILEKDVIDSEDDIAKSLFVEAFNSREAYIESVMDEFNETDKLEKKMSKGSTIKIPGYIYDDDDDESLNDDKTPATTNSEFEIDSFVLDVSELIEDLIPLDQSKYTKVFEKDGEFTLGVHNSRIKTLSRRKSIPLSTIPANVKSVHFKTCTKTFTKMTATSSIGAANTSAGYCVLVNLRNLSSETRIRILGVLGKEDVNVEEAMHETAIDEDLIPSQDFPNMFQSQTSDTLLHCSVCEFMTRSKTEFDSHMNDHPSCHVCQKRVNTEATLVLHMVKQHPSTTVKCTVCNKDVKQDEISNHMKEHEIFDKFKSGLQRNQTQTPKTKPPKKKNCYIIFLEENRAEMKINYPNLSAIEITKKLSEEWNKLSDYDKKRYKEKASQLKDHENSEPCPKCGEMFPTKADVIKHLLANHVENTVQETVVPSQQSTIHKCNSCGRMFINIEKLNDHKQLHESPEETVDNAMEIDDTPMDEDHSVTQQNTSNNNDLLSNKDNFVWVKIANLFWPAKIVKKIGELTEIELYDDEGTRKTVDQLKLKPFEVLAKVPTKRSKAWKDAYAKAVEEFE